ncbi:polyprenyl synthetase family protein [Streptomyces sp. NPDC048172]|uniref:polyprenyl synthetase family protein n=1 Tax=Streptomyces sp. NPDC048172 TaxID=3365505 RepID=UPI0037135F29
MSPAGSPRQPPIADQELATDIKAELVDIEEIIRESIKSEMPLLHEASQHLMDAGGKRHRPMLTLLAARFGDPTGPSVLSTAAACELVHAAALCHDDVLDGATLRRGRPSVNARWNDAVAMLTGDFLFARAFLLLARLPVLEARLEVNTFVRLVTGQIREMTGPAEGEDPAVYYATMVSEKTASLLCACLRLGALTSGAEPEAVQALERYGEAFGLAFQISDDLLDLFGEEEKSGKRPGTDLVQGAPTLPLLYALNSPGEDSDRLRELLGTTEPGGRRTALGEAECAEAIELLRHHSAVARTRERLDAYVEEARAALAPLPDGPAKDTLDLLCAGVAHRAS